MTDSALCNAVAEMARGLIDADLVFRFEKNDRTNIADDELEALQELAKQLLARTAQQLDDAVQDGSLQEICHEHKT